ncbi:MAG: SLC13 family permease [Tepidanaerobacteraceae bacterium]|jgi:di/tricarboxylate transporter
MKLIKSDKKLIIIIFSIIAFISIYMMPIPDLPIEGRKCLAIIIFAVIWLAGNVTAPAYTSLVILTSYVILMDPNVVSIQEIMYGWTTPVIYMVIAGFLLAEAVTETGLGKRIALFFLTNFVNSYKSMIILCYVLNIILCIIIPHPWPRCILLASILVSVLTDFLPKEHLRQITLAIFAGGVSTSLIFLTGDPSFSSVVCALSKTNVSFFDWFYYMFFPGMFVTIITCVSQLLLFRLPNISINKETILKKITLKPITRKEKRLIFWLAIALILWSAGSVINVDAGWSSALIVAILSLPVVGDVIDATTLKRISIDTVIFLVAILSIGSVSKASGMSDWLARLLLSFGAPSNPWLFAFVATLICMALHMIIGSSLSAMGVITPPLISLGTTLGFPEIFPALISFLALAGHWVLPYQHLTIQIGQNQTEESYTTGEVLLLSIPQTIAILLASQILTTWFAFIGMI